MFPQRSQVRRPVRNTVGATEALEERVLPAISFQFDYSLDTNNFFNTQQKKDLLSYAGLMLTAQLSDTLSAITPSGKNTWSANLTHPATGQSKTIANPSLGTGVIRVYVGSRNISELGIANSGGYSSSGSTSWLNLVKGRGNSGALGSAPSDVAPRMSSITFDSSGTSWFFGKTTSGLGSGQSDFVSVAMHELGHVLGIGNSSSVTSWNRLISGGRFTGAKARAENNGINPSASSGHLGEGVKNDGIEVAMDPTLTSGTRKFMSELDFAVLDDIGWERSSSDDSIFRARHQLTHKTSSGGLSVGDSVLLSRSIESSKDVDLYRVWADAGTTLEVIVRRPTGKAAFDSYIRLFDAAGSQLGSANQGGLGGTDTLKFNTTRSDYYFIGVSSSGNRTYSPTSTSSGPGGKTGVYLLAISADDASSRLAAFSKQSGGTARATDPIVGAEVEAFTPIESDTPLLNVLTISIESDHQSIGPADNKPDHTTRSNSHQAGKAVKYRRIASGTESTDSVFSDIDLLLSTLSR